MIVVRTRRIAAVDLLLQHRRTKGFVTRDRVLGPFVGSRAFSGRLTAHVRALGPLAPFGQDAVFARQRLLTENRLTDFVLCVYVASIKDCYIYNVK